MKIGFVGLGSMGMALAVNLLESGHEMCVYNRDALRAEPLRNAGATVAATPAEAARSADLVITMVADDAALRAVSLGETGVVAGLHSGAVHVSMNTIGIDTAQEIAEAHRKAGLGFVTAPVFGRPDAAAARKLFIMAAGASEDLDLVLPVLEQLGQSVRVVGSDPAHASLVKLIGNFMLTGIIEMLGEACAVAGKAGISPTHLIDLLTGATFNSPVFKLYGQLIATQSFEPAGFSLPLGQKDNRLILAAANTLGVPLPLANLVHDRFLTLRAQGFGAQHDWSAVGLGALQDAGLGRTRKEG